MLYKLFLAYNTKLGFFRKESLRYLETLLFVIRNGICPRLQLVSSAYEDSQETFKEPDALFEKEDNNSN